MIPITQDDVQAALSRDLTDDEAEALPDKALIASDVVEGYLGIVYNTAATPPDVVPGVVTRVTAGLVGRVFTAAGKVPIFQDTLSQAMGPFNTNTHFIADASSGDPWLTKVDKLRLRSVYAGVRSVSFRSERC
jgi:hypothetical protein